MLAEIPKSFVGSTGEPHDFPGADNVQSLTEDDFRRFGPVSYSEFSSGYHRNFNGALDRAVYAEIANLAASRHPAEPVKQQALIASYFKWRGISWEGVA